MGLAPHIGQRTDRICFKVSFSDFTAIVFNIGRLTDGQSCSGAFDWLQNGNRNPGVECRMLEAVVARLKLCPPDLFCGFQGDYLLDWNRQSGLVGVFRTAQANSGRALSFFQEDIKSVSSDDLDVISGLHGLPPVARMSKCAATAELGGYPRSYVQGSGVLIDGGGGLGTAVTGSVVEVEGGDTMFAECTSKDGAAVRRFGCVISHVFSVVLPYREGLGQ